MDRRSKIIIGAIALAVVAASGVVLFLSQPTGEDDQVALTSPTPQIPPFSLDDLPTVPPQPEDLPQPTDIATPQPNDVGMTAETGPAHYILAALLAAAAAGTLGLTKIAKI